MWHLGLCRIELYFVVGFTCAVYVISLGLPLFLSFHGGERMEVPSRCREDAEGGVDNGRARQSRGCESIGIYRVFVGYGAPNQNSAASASNTVGFGQ
jgi:hypothetical protein